MLKKKKDIAMKELEEVSNPMEPVKFNKWLSNFKATLSPKEFKRRYYVKGFVNKGKPVKQLKYKKGMIPNDVKKTVIATETETSLNK